MCVPLAQRHRMWYHSFMDRRELRRRVAQHPNAVSFDELRALLEAYGWSLHRIRSSHHIFHGPAGRVTVPYRRPHVLPVYVKQVLAITEGMDDDNDA